MAAHLGFVNGAVQCIVLLVILQTEVQGPQCSCKDRRGERREKEKEISGTQNTHWGQKKPKCVCLLSLFKRKVLMGNLKAFLAVTCYKSCHFQHRIIIVFTQEIDKIW